MIRHVLRAGAAGLILVTHPAFAAASPINQACMRSDRDAVNRAACNCIQGVADFTLKDGDQRKVAGFFKDPERAEKARAADGKADEAFWDRYESFGTQAELYCGG